MRALYGYSHSSVPIIVDLVSFLKLLQMHTHSSRGNKKRKHHCVLSYSSSQIPPETG